MTALVTTAINTELREPSNSARWRVSAAVNAELSQLYWRVGARINPNAAVMLTPLTTQEATIMALQNEIKK